MQGTLCSIIAAAEVLCLAVVHSNNGHIVEHVLCAKCKSMGAERDISGDVFNQTLLLCL